MDANEQNVYVSTIKELIDKIQNPELKQMVERLVELELNSNKEQEKHSYLTGWVCPICGKVYAPHVTQCFHCNNTGNWWDPSRIVYATDLNYKSQSNQNATTTMSSVQTIANK